MKLITPLEKKLIKMVANREAPGYQMTSYGHGKVLRFVRRILKAVKKGAK